MANKLTKSTTKEINPADINNLSLVVFDKGNENPYKFQTEKFIDIIQQSQPPVTIPSLQEVTDAGNTTTADITVNKITSANGEVKPYKSYTARISQNGTDIPTAIELQNDFGVTGTFVRNSPGLYILSINGAFPDLSKAFFILQDLVGTSYEMDLLSINQLIIVTYDEAGNPADGLLNKRGLKIEVYN